MENQLTRQSETSAEKVKIGNVGRRLPMAGLVLGTIAITFAITCFTAFSDASPSRPSTPLEIDAQKEFQKKLNTALEEYQEKVDVATKEAQQKSNSIGK